jgi:acylphosphatase
LEVVRVSVRIKGRVQGVFFRQATCDKARSLHLTGWVRNRPDGDVEAVFEGPRQAVEKILAWCEQGPDAASVAEVKTRHDIFTGEYATFMIKEEEPL